MTSIDHEAPGLHGPGVGLVIVGLVFGVISAATVTGRLLSRFTTKRIVGSDDYFIVASLVCAIAFTIVTTIGVSYGYGRPDKSLSKENLQSALKTFFACQITYKLSMNLTKLSILALYLRVFPNNWFRLVVRWFFGALVVFAMFSIGATILQCQPIARNWNRELPGRCFALVKFWYFNAAVSIFSDLFILLLPMPLIVALQLPRGQKLGLVMIFGLGVFVCITSIVRMTVLKTGAVSTDTSHGTLQSTIWTAVECHTAIICASLPMLKSTMAKFFPRIFPQSRASNTEGNTEAVHNDDHPISSISRTPVKDDCEAAPVPPAWLYSHNPASHKQVKEAEGNCNDHEITLAHLDQKIPTVYLPKGSGCPPTDVITKTTDIRVDYVRKDEEEDSSSTDSVFRFGSQVSSNGPRQSRKSLPHRH